MVFDCEPGQHSIPSPHGRQLDDEFDPTAVEKEPPLQAVHVAAPVFSWYVPRPQLEQTTLPVPGATVPASHRVHSFSPGMGATDPGAQGMRVSFLQKWPGAPGEQKSGARARPRNSPKDGAMDAMSETSWRPRAAMPATAGIE